MNYDSTTTTVYSAQLSMLITTKVLKSSIIGVVYIFFIFLQTTMHKNSCKNCDLINRVLASKAFDADLLFEKLLL